MLMMTVMLTMFDDDDVDDDVDDDDDADVLSKSPQEQNEESRIATDQGCCSQLLSRSPENLNQSFQ